MRDEHLRRALAEQEAELRQLDEKLAELRPLQQRRDSLLTLVTQMRHILQVPPKQAEPAASAAEEQPGKIGKRPIWAVAREVLHAAKKPMRVPEITETLRGLGFESLSGKNGRDTVRRMLTKKPNVFRKLEDGRFELRNHN